MKRVKCLGRYPKGVLLLMIVMVLVFTILYPITIAREGFEYKNAILIPHQENGNTIYSGKIQGKQASFAVYADKQWNSNIMEESTVPISPKRIQLPSQKIVRWENL